MYSDIQSEGPSAINIVACFELLTIRRNQKNYVAVECSDSFDLNEWA